MAKKITFEKGKHYAIDNKSQKIYADVEKLTPKEIRAIKNYKALGYNLVEYKEEKQPKYTNDNMIDYIRKNAKNVEVELQAYENAKQLPSKDGAGTQGFMGAYRYFKKTYGDVL